MSKRRIILSFISFSLFSSLFFQNCDGMNSIGGIIGSKGTSTGNPSLHLSFAAYGDVATGTAFRKRNTTIVMDSLQNVAVVMCISGVKFKKIVDAPDSDLGSVFNVNFSPRQLALSPLGTDLDFISVPASVYRQVVFELNSSKCSSGISIAVSNSYGQFSSNEPINLRFNGEKNVDFSVEEIGLKIQEIVGALSTVTSDQEIKGKVEAALGEL